MPCDYSNNVANPQAHVGGLLGKSQKTKLHPSLGNVHKGGHLLRRFRVQNKGDNPAHLVSSLDQKGCLALPLKPRGPHSNCPGANPLLQGCLSTESDNHRQEQHLKSLYFIGGCWYCSQHSPEFIFPVISA